MTEDEKQALRDSFAGKSVSQMTPGECKIFDADFQYGFGNKPVQKRATVKATLPKKLPASTLSVLSRIIKNPILIAFIVFAAYQWLTSIGFV